jgi:prepilin-type N-terminal cleavage/methylation domain-containing protein
MLFRRTAKGKPHRGEAGFALIEVLVAVAVASVLMAVLIRSFVSTWAGVNIVRDEAEGTLLARSILDELLLRGTLAAGSQDGTMGRYAWNVTTTMQTVTTVPAAQPRSGEEGNQRNQGNQQNQLPATANIFHVVVTMRGPSGRSNRLDAYKIGQITAQ